MCNLLESQNTLFPVFCHFTLAKKIAPSAGLGRLFKQFYFTALQLRTLLNIYFCRGIQRGFTCHPYDIAFHPAVKCAAPL